MMNGAPLAQPIRGDVSRDGRLVFADEALRRLHHRAGGSEGGTLAIPGLAALASLANRLRMRLSRAVRVADGHEDLELWVEAIPADDLARLSILSWRAMPSAATHTDRDFGVNDLPAEEGRSSLLFDASLRLIGVSGSSALQMEAGDFGKSAQVLIARLVADNAIVTQLIEAMRTARPFGPTSIVDPDAEISLTGVPQPAVDGTLSAYRCDISIARPRLATSSAASPGVLFGRQFAPVLRQPLGRIIANAETIGSELKGPIRENYALYAKDIANAARHLVALVDDLGDLEAVERADFSTAQDDIELGDVARRVAGLLALKAADHSIRITAPAESERIPAVAEFRRVLQILLNLVTNAIRYSPDGTEVLIEIGANGENSFVTVSDQGRGISAEKRDAAFEKFERLGRTGDGGSGLGLYISRRLARAMNGDLTVGEAVTGGARFTLTLPSG